MSGNHWMILKFPLGVFAFSAISGRECHSAMLHLLSNLRPQFGQSELLDSYKKSNSLEARDNNSITKVHDCVMGMHVQGRFNGTRKAPCHDLVRQRPSLASGVLPEDTQSLQWVVYIQKGEIVLTGILPNYDPKKSKRGWHEH